MSIPKGSRVLALLALFGAFLLARSAPCGAADEKGSGPNPAAHFPKSLTLTKIAGGFDKPTTITHAGDGSGRLFVLEQAGIIRIIHSGKVSPIPFLDIRRLVKSGGERGLLGLAFPPGYASLKSFYVNYTNRTGIGNTVVARFGLSSDPDRADPASREQLLTIIQPFPNHNGGQVAFGPDRMLYVGTGDGGAGGDPFGNGQNRKVRLGKLLRLDVLGSAKPYGIPAGNPFGDEIWAYGLRNPWRFSFDRATGDLYIADVGQNEVEEIDFQPAGKGAGANYGWNRMEGSRCFKEKNCDKTGLTLPVAEYYQGSGDCSVTGGYVYRGNSAALRGIYIYGDYCSGRIWGLRRDGAKWETRLLKESGLKISTFGEDEAGELYLADHAKGDIYRIGAAGD